MQPSEVQRAAETARVRRIYDRLATSRAMSDEDGWLLRGATEWLRERAQGDALEVGIGRGRTLPSYGPNVRLTGVELSDRMLAFARSRAASLGVEARLLQGDAQALPFPDAHFDTVVFSMVLCTVPDDRLAVAEAVRVLRPGGHLLLIEHVRSTHLAVRALQHLIGPIMLRQIGDHFTREPLGYVLAAGLEIVSLDRQRLAIMEYLDARKPETEAEAIAV